VKNEIIERARNTWARKGQLFTADAKPMSKLAMDLQAAKDGMS